MLAIISFFIFIGSTAYTYAKYFTKVDSSHISNIQKWEIIVNNENIKGNKILKIAIMSIRIVVYIALALFILVVCMQRFSNNKISFFNFRMFTVVSQSMTPKYDIGDINIEKEYIEKVCFT